MGNFSFIYIGRGKDKEPTPPPLLDQSWQMNENFWLSALTAVKTQTEVDAIFIDTKI